MHTLETPRAWAKTHFGQIEMADVRRVARVVTIAEAMATHPGHSIPQMFEHPYEVKAAYHFFNLEEATPDRRPRRIGCKPGTARWSSNACAELGPTCC